MKLWHPDATIDKFDDAGGFLAGPYRGVLHATEGSSYAGAKGSYAKNRSAPHLTIGVEGLWQHIALDRAARALQNAPAGVQTNLQSAIQVEVIHFSSEPWPDRLVEVLRDLMIWIEGETGIHPWAPLFAGSDAYGVRTPWRMNFEAWEAFDGWCGHQHVPENSHWDPGALIPIDRLLERSIVAGEIRLNYPPRVIVARPQGDGYWIVAYDGGVFPFGNAPGLYAIGGDPVEKIISADAWPDGEGLLCMGEDGGVFGLGTAKFHGRVFFG